MRRIGFLAASLLMLLTVAAPVATAAPGRCGHAQLAVPGAEHQRSACLDELTTAGTVESGHTDREDWAGLTPKGLPIPRGVSGIQLDGYFPDDSRTNTNHGWRHDSQFVIRLPERWNGGLVVSGAPGNREQYANDRAISDWVLARGYAFASTDKGNTGSEFFRDGTHPGAAISEWNHRMTQLARAAKSVVAQNYGRPARTTLATGLSNGGYLVRWQLENRPELYDGGVDWEGTLWSARSPHLLTFLPPALRAYPRYAEGGPGSGAARREIVEAGFAPESEFLWDAHYRTYWDLTQRIYREELDPSFDGTREAGFPFCESGTPRCDADYDYAARRPIAGPALERIALTGDLRRPLLTVHGTLDALLPIERSSDVYAGMVRQNGGEELHRYYRIEGGNHADGFVDSFPDRLRPLTPCHRAAFTALERWSAGVRPPDSGTVPWPVGTTAAERRTECELDPVTHG